MNCGDERQARGEKNKSQTTEHCFSQQLDHPSKNPRADNHADSAQVHDEVPDVLLRNAEPIGEDKRQDRAGSIECANGDRIDPDETRCRIVGMCQHAPYGSGTLPLVSDDRHFHRRRASRFLQEFPGESADEQTKRRRAKTGCGASAESHQS